LCEAKLRYGSDNAAANVLDVEDEEADVGWFVMTGDPGTLEVPTAPEIL